MNPEAERRKSAILRAIEEVLDSGATLIVVDNERGQDAHVATGTDGMRTISVRPRRPAGKAAR